MLVGSHGIGKSEIIRDYYASKSMRVIPFFLGQMSDPGDLIGLLHKNATTGRSEFLPPAWWPADDQPVVLFLDELNRGRPEVLQSVMELTLSKTLAGKSLPLGSVIVAAVNDGDEYQLTDLDPALVSRFNVYQFKPSVVDWLSYAENRLLDRRVVDFVKDSPHWLDGEPTVGQENRYQLAIEKRPDRRAWTRVAELISPMPELEPLAFKLIAGIVGSPAAAAFRTFIASRLPIKVDDIFDGREASIETAVSMTTEQIARLNELLVRRILDQNQTLPTDGVHRYLSRLVELQKRESVAHFVSLTQRPSSSNITKWIAGSIKLTILIAQYLDSIAASNK